MLLISMAAFSQLLAAQKQPSIQRRQIVKGQPGSEQLATQKLNLVLDLTTRRRPLGSNQWRLNGSLCNAVDLINALIAEQSDGNTGKIIRQLTALDCVIIDELGYIGLRPFLP